MQFGQVHHIEYYVNDLKKSNQFWDWFMPVLGYKRIAEFDGGVSWEHQNGTYIVFVQVEDNYLNHQNKRRASGLNHIAFQGGSVESLDQLEADLKAREVKVLKRDGDYLLFEDSNEFAVEVYARV